MSMFGLDADEVLLVTCGLEGQTMQLGLEGL